MIARLNIFTERIYKDHSNFPFVFVLKIHNSFTAKNLNIMSLCQSPSKLEVDVFIQLTFR